ncbi:Oidioi.mRNA.OKI2018_I69.chr1.g448.t1.cds [Oikopleura dioica]|uniref:Oidioi.mRNA.OKI2018_I69.chr1.g448.t1.cds n=1 Tax=Oikopleura dioica TaxID=34765 RepID=A0ABN7SPX9_OIKDI|nr:Oidioi.mRNA.OKI2018_I69.chr1.g448.t1.cds [Oikopleura dioica]
MTKTKKIPKSYSGIDFGFIDRKGARLFFILQIFLISVSVIGIATSIWGLFDKNISSKEIYIKPLGELFLALFTGIFGLNALSRDSLPLMVCYCFLVFASIRDTISLTIEATKVFSSNREVTEDLSENEVIATCVRDSLFMSSLLCSFFLQFSSVVFVIKQWYKMHPTSGKGLEYFSTPQYLLLGANPKKLYKK